MTFVKTRIDTVIDSEIKRRSLKIILTLTFTLAALLLLYYNLHPLADFLIFKLAGLEQAKHLSEALNFFIYDTLKILILLFIISSLMGIVNTYFPIERLKNYLNTKKLYGLQYLFAALFGAITPFCSCSSIPLFIGFINGGLPLGVTLAFLITSPLVNEVAVVMFLGLFGIKATIIYVTGGILLGTLGGMFLSRFKLDNYLTEWVRQIQMNSTQNNLQWKTDKITLIDKLPGIFQEGWEIVRKVLVYVIVGIAIGAAMHGYVPENFFSGYLSSDKWYAVPLAVIFAVPMYANAAGIVPVIQVFVAKGVPLGTAIAFMMGVVGLSIPEATLLKKVMTWKLIAIFFTTITFFIIVLGYVFNLLL